MYIEFACKYVRLFAIILRLFAMFLHDSHSHRSEIGTEYLIRIRIVQKFGSPNIPNVCKQTQKSSGQEVLQAPQAQEWKFLQADWVL